MGDAPLSYAECMEILRLYRNWNTCQEGMTPSEAEILDSRRKLLLAAQERLRQLVTGNDPAKNETTPTPEEQP